MISAGVCLLFRNYAIPPAALAVAVEERGFDTLFVPENTHMPISRRHSSRYPQARMKALGSLYDPFVLLGAFAAVTRRIHLGLSVCLLTHRDAIATAKSVSSLDVLCGGRLILGVAGGVVAEAMENHGSSFKDRWRIVREKTLAMRSIWAQDCPEFHGEFVDFGPLVAHTKPLQNGGPPIWIGSNSAAVPGRVADYADGWIVFDGRYQGDPIADLKRACEARERDFDDLTISLMDAPHEGSGLRQRMQAGFRRFIFMLQVDDENEARHSLDALAIVVAQLRRE
ncbi:MAG: TIGR03619 family F420-dependent LLM class oxidoreductase [Proteobacteria bacterium]|nr:MAG: TIGR03619 family F420-dependent LLM class oxidoreductase [Pseudomonadota bacterium]